MVPNFLANIRTQISYATYSFHSSQIAKKLKYINTTSDIQNTNVRHSNFSHFLNIWTIGCRNKCRRGLLFSNSTVIFSGFCRTVECHSGVIFWYNYWYLIKNIFSLSWRVFFDYFQICNLLSPFGFALDLGIIQMLCSETFNEM